MPSVSDLFTQVTLSFDEKGMRDDTPINTFGNAGKLIQVALFAKAFHFGLIKIHGQYVFDKGLWLMHFESRALLDPRYDGIIPVPFSVFEHKMKLVGKAVLLVFGGGVAVAVGGGLRFVFLWLLLLHHDHYLFRGGGFHLLALFHILLLQDGNEFVQVSSAKLPILGIIRLCSCCDTAWVLGEEGIHEQFVIALLVAVAVAVPVPVIVITTLRIKELVKGRDFRLFELNHRGRRFPSVVY